VFVAGYGHFLRTAAASQWDEAAVDLSVDARAWPSLEPGLRERASRLVAGFCLAEAAVAADIAPFASAAADPDAAACFEAQRVDEERHARFFDRVAAEVVGIPGRDRAERMAAMEGLVEPALVELFEVRLPAVARGLAGQEPGERLAEAVALYHLLLEGVVFSAGQGALLGLLERAPDLPGLRRGVELVLRDERWHIGLGARVLDDLGLEASGGVDEVLAEADAALAAWGDLVSVELAERVLGLHRRRLAAARLRARAPA
jgi:ribonucleoside-diphosphate reductase beta chain